MPWLAVFCGHATTRASVGSLVSLLFVDFSLYAFDFGVFTFPHLYLGVVNGKSSGYSVCGGAVLP